MVKRLYKEEHKGFILDDRHEMLDIYASPCTSCKHFMQDDYYCLAYPDGIPDRLLEGKDTHNDIRKDQTGTTVFEKED